MARKNFKRESKAKSNVVQYLIIGVICLPILIWFGINSETKWQLSQPLTIFIMCCIILAVWLAWVGVRSLIRKRSERFIQEKRQNRSKKKI